MAGVGGTSEKSLCVLVGVKALWPESVHWLFLKQNKTIQVERAAGRMAANTVEKLGVFHQHEERAVLIFPGILTHENI